MRHMKARQRNEDGRWDWTTDMRGKVVPCGYCCDFIELDLDRYPHIPESALLQHRLYKEKHHTDGHATVEEAAACYREYMLDHEFRSWEDKSSQHKCRVCGAWTSHIVEVGSLVILSLCTAHSSKDHVRPLVNFDEIWSS